MANDAFVEQGGRHPRHRGFAGGIDIEQQHRIGVVECRAELLLQEVRAGVAMWLKHHHQTLLWPYRFGGPQRLANLLRMMAIIVHHGDTVACPRISKRRCTPLNSSSALAMVGSGTSSSTPTAMAARAL